jgi:hypothetical protein
MMIKATMPLDSGDDRKEVKLKYEQMIIADTQITKRSRMTPIN